MNPYMPEQTMILRIEHSEIFLSIRNPKYSTILNKILDQCNLNFNLKELFQRLVRDLTYTFKAL